MPKKVAKESTFIKFINENVKSPSIRRTIIRFAGSACEDISAEECESLMQQICEFCDEIEI